ncbi:hypothetical protein TNCV_123911 [Trichonephila clavipes]|nr:hypothetical protein TNCV_123911 [Trichonephila clavipes]
MKKDSNAEMNPGNVKGQSLKDQARLARNRRRTYGWKLGDGVRARRRPRHMIVGQKYEIHVATDHQWLRSRTHGRSVAGSTPGATKSSRVEKADAC